jgi:hypothetical protein
MSESYVGFYVPKYPSQGYYSEIVVGIYFTESSGAAAEFNIGFTKYTLGPIFEVFSDCGTCFEKEPFQILWRDFLDQKVPRTPDEFKNYLLSLGFRDYQK